MDNAEFQKLLNARSSLVLVASRKKALLLVLGASFFMAGCLHMILDADRAAVIAGWIILLFCDAVLLLGLWMLAVPWSQSLILDHQGFKVKSPLFERVCSWKNVSEFVSRPIGMSQQVFFDDGSTSKRAKTQRALTGYNCAMSDTYQLSAHQLAQLMNHWRERAITNNSN